MKNGKEIDIQGTIRYYKDDEFHREDGPAVEWSDGTKYWYMNDRLHREDGPAMEWNSGWKAWYLNNIEYSEEEYKIRIRNKRIKNLLEMI